MNVEQTMVFAGISTTRLTKDTYRKVKGWLKKRDRTGKDGLCLVLAAVDRELLL